MSVLFQLSAGSSNAGSSVVSAAKNTSGVNLLIVGVGFYTGSGGGSGITLTDSKSNTWTALTKRTSTNGVDAQFFYCASPTVGSGHTFSVASVGGVCYPALIVTGESNALASPFDAQNGGTVAPGTSLSTGSITPAGANELVIGFCVSSGTAMFNDALPNAHTLDGAANNAVCVGSAYAVQITAAAVNPQFSWTTSSDGAAAIAAFKVNVSTAATGSVHFTGVLMGSSGDFTGFPKYNAFDNNLTSLWGASGNAGWIGLDLGASAAVTAYELTSQASSSNGTEEKRLFGALIQSGATIAFSSPTTVDTIATPPVAPFNPPGVRTSHAISASGRAWRVLFSASGSIAELAFIGTAGTAVPSRPCRPVISPFGGSAVGGSKTVTITSATTSASIYYTIDGSAPTTASTLYAGPFTLTVAGATTVRAIAYDTTCTTALSQECNAAHFRTYEFGPNETWYDSNGEILEAKCPSIAEWPVGSGTYWMASNSGNVGLVNTTDQIGRYGVWLYSATLTSTGFSVWVNHGNVLATPTSSAYTNVLRPSLLACPSTGAMTLWVHGYDSPNQNLHKLHVYSCTASDLGVPANWTDHGDLLPDGVSSVGDFSRCTFNGDGYLLYTTNGTEDPITISKLASNYRNTTGTDKLNIPGTAGLAGSESPVAVQWGTKLIVFYDATFNYYDSTSTYLVKRVTATTNPLSSGAYSSVTAAFASDPVGGNFNGQPASIFTVPNKVNGFMLIADYWTGGKWGLQEPSRSVWLPIDVSGATPVISTPATWDFTTFTDAPSSGGVGSVGAGLGIFCGLGANNP